jgi:pimeloyl-ACP methyl ester carboxylesterase
VGLVFQDVSFASRVDRVELKGWFLPSDSDSVLLIVHGGFQNRVDPIVHTLELSRDLVNRGYNILLFDLRGRGESQGEARSLSNMERDIGGAIDYLNSRGYPPCRIGIIGYCSGAASACIFASKEDVGGVVLDGCFTSVRHMVYHQASSRGIPRVPVIVFVPGVQLAATVFYGYEGVNPIDVVGKVRCPIFFIHEENDDLVPPQETIELFNASGNPVNMYWQIPNTLHNRSYETHPTEYAGRLDAFFRIALKSTTSTN